MSSTAPNCEWCKESPSTTSFQDSSLCNPCHAKAVVYSQDPHLFFRFLAAIDASRPLPKYIPTCKWCSVSLSSTLFSDPSLGLVDVALCEPCHAKAQANADGNLCEQCEAIFTEKGLVENLFDEEGGGYFHSGVIGLREQCEMGCRLCRMMWLADPNEDAGRMAFTGLNLFAGRAISLEQQRTEGPHVKKGVVGDVNMLTFSSLEDQFRLDMAVSTDIDDVAARFVSQRPPEANLGSETTNLLIKSWLFECLSKHPESLTNELPLLPSRVVDVGTGPEATIKLLETPPGFRAQYITLSYCWGRPRFLVTLLSNLEAHKRGLELDRLPLTFQDAIITTRNLGFRYIWIDALCIIQDSVEDKVKEIGKMGDIYNDSTLTIAVVGATAVAEGFLKAKPHAFVKLPYRCPDGMIGSVKVSLQKQSDLWQESLYTRAWCLQENLLSPRLLLYTDTEVIWQCQTAPMKRPATTHVSYVREDPKMGSSPFNRLPVDVLRPTNTDDDPKRTPHLDAERYQIWRSLVQNYTRRNLTVASDRLPALSGIAQKFEVAWKDKNLSGIWERQLLPSLAWRRSMDREQSYSPPLKEHRAPSWSWASIDGPVEFDTRFDLGNLRGSGAKIHSCSADMNAQGRETVVIEGYMIPVAQVMNGEEFNNEVIVEEDRLGELVMDNHDDDGRWPQIPDRLGGFDEEMKGICWRFLLGEGRDGVGKMTRTTALVLMQATGEDENTFCRIGLWRSSEKGVSRLWFGNHSGKGKADGKVRNNRRVIKIL